MSTVHTRNKLEKLKDFARILYIRDRLTQGEVSIKTGVHHNTINRWSVEGGWKNLRRDSAAIREQQIDYMLDELIELNASILRKPEEKRYADAEEGGIRRKLVQSIKDLQSGIPLYTVMEVAKEAVSFMCKIDVQKAVELSALFDKYIESILLGGIQPPAYNESTDDADPSAEEVAPMVIEAQTQQ